MRSGINASITVRAFLDGYVEDERTLTIAIKPRILSVQITTEPNAAFSEGILTVTVHIGYDTDSIAGANVTVRGESGSFSSTTGSTDNYGNVTFIFTAPQVNEQSNITVTALATADGYVESETPLQITVNPRARAPEGGLPLTTILLIAIPIVIAVVVAMLIKLKLIVISTEDSEEET